MKKCLICTFIFLSSVVFAQTDALRDKLNLVFSNINKSQIPTGFLEEYGVHLVPLDVWNGVLTDSNKVNIYAWRQVYATLQSSRIHGTNPLNDVEAVNASIENAGLRAWRIG